MSIDNIIENIITIEGGYSNNPLDAGGETMYGITFKVARANGYTGAIKDLPKATAKQIYLNMYYYEPHFDKISMLSEDIAAELVDTGINCGTGFAKPLIQEALNLLNRQGKDYKDITEDGSIGPATVTALTAYLNKRGKTGEVVMLKLLNVLQGSHYVAITKARAANEEFLYGWLANRVTL